jgi:hypothetical protein
MDERVWRIFYVVRIESLDQEIEDLALRIRALSSCRSTCDTGLAVVTARYVVQLLEAPIDALRELIDDLQISANARLLLSEASPYRWFGASMRGALTDQSLDRILDAMLAAPEKERPGSSLLCSLADSIARRIRALEPRLQAADESPLTA